MNLISRLRTMALHAASGAGVFREVQSSRWRRRRLSILCYHGISLDDEHEWRPGLYLTPDQFGRRVRRLAELGANVMTLSEGLRRLADGSLPDAAVSITFDDGGRDFHSKALPLLEAAGLPATVYLTTYYALAGVPIFSLAVDYLLWRGRSRTLPAWPEMGIPEPVPLANLETRWRVGHAIVTATRGPNFPLVRREAVLDSLAGQVGEDMQSIRRRGLMGIMGPDEVSDCVRRGVSMELHTHRHRMPRDRNLFLRELEDNREVIRRLSGAVATHFCYPSGDYTTTAFPWLAEAGVASATTCEVALATRRSHRYRIPRFLDTSLQSDLAFDGWVTGAAAFLSRRPRSTQSTSA